jgi:NADPH:quinone reductase-like Zn-dependent oxidoreductase
VAPALPEDHDYLSGLGVTELVDRSADITAAVRAAHPDGVDALLDVVSFTPDASVLKKGGRLASSLGAAGEGIGRFNLVASPSPSNLERLGKLLEAGDLRVPIQHRYSLDRGGQALDSLQNAHTQGKLAIQIA